jgi:hypothetical protein
MIKTAIALQTERFAGESARAPKDTHNYNAAVIRALLRSYLGEDYNTWP